MNRSDTIWYLLHKIETLETALTIASGNYHTEYDCPPGCTCEHTTKKAHTECPKCWKNYFINKATTALDGE